MARMMPVHVAIVDDDAWVRAGFARWIGDAPGFACVAALSSAEEALDQLPGRKVDVVLMDIGLPGMSGVDCIPRLRAQVPEVQVMMLTVFEDDDCIFRSLQAGATGYLTKKTPPEQILAAVRELHNGGSPMTSGIARRVVQAFQRRPLSAGDGGLSEREIEILTSLAQGLLYKEIAEVRGVTLETVRSHVRRIYEKLQVHTRTDAVNALFGHPATRPGTVGRRVSGPDGA